MNLIKRLVTILLVTVACSGCDQGTRSLASQFLSHDQMTSHFFDTFRLGNTENTGAFLVREMNGLRRLGF